MKKSKDHLRVAMVGDYPQDLSQIKGGVQAAFAYLVKGLTAIDRLDLHVLTFQREAQRGPERLEQNGVTLHLLQGLPRFERLRNYNTYQAILNRKLAELQPDIIHAQETTANAKVALRSGYPTIVTAHGMCGEDGKYYSAWSRRLRHYFDSLFSERYTIRHVRHLIVISHYVTDYFAPLLRPDLQTYYVPNAIDGRFFERTSSVPGNPVILFAGRVTPLKRVLDLVQAFARFAPQMPSAHLRIAGECTSEPVYAETVRRWIREAGLEAQIHLLGPLAETAILREFAECTLVALPSSQESAPMVLAQAMAAGKPVVATRVGGVGEMVGEDGQRGYLVSVGDVGGLAQAMQRLLKDVDLRTRMGQAGCAHAKANYHLEIVAQRTYEVYQAVAAAERRS